MKIPFLKDLARNRTLWLMALPAILVVLVINYAPMFGIGIAFQDFQFDKGLLRSPFIGFKNFEYFFSSGKALQLTLNTIGYNVAFLAFNTFLEVVMAVVIFEMGGRRLKRVFQSAMILPYFISWIIIGGFVYNLLNYEYGAVNTFLASIGVAPLNVYSDPEAWRVILPVVNAVQAVGFGSIIYLSAISGIDTEMYESAYIDGAGFYRRVWHITLPNLLPTVVIMILLSLGTVLRGNFEMFFPLIGNNGQLFKTTDVIDTYVFRTLVISSNSIGSASAAGFYQQFIGLLIILGANRLVKKVAPSYELF
jgi:putative aldouronate transport system permease protein